MSEVTASQLQDRSSNIILNNTNGILQVVQSVKTGHQAISGGSAPEYGVALVTDMEVTITKTSPRSKILVIVDMRVAGTSSYNRQEWILMRDGEPCFIGQGQNQLDYQNAAGTNNCTGRMPVNSDQPATSMCSTGCWFLDHDSEELQSTMTYAVFAGDRNGDSTVYINRGRAGTTASNQTICASSITAIEVA